MNTPLSMTTPAPLAPAEGYSLALLTACGRLDHIGVFDAHSSACQPRVTLSLAEFAQQLKPLNVMGEAENLVVPPTAASGRCPLVILQNNQATGARVCFTADGGVYRAVGADHESDWAWRLDKHGQWRLAQTAIQALASR